ncbi:MAG TPA: response regulator transcription factor [Bradyrhizobium sp.]|nr:response regulator transcription factor [Bradyrhizobium sp.]
MKMLVVDDHTVVREGLRRLLSAFLDVTIVEASCSREAVSLFRAESPDVVLLDINLPGFGGLDLLRRLLLMEPKARVLMLTMHVSPIYVARALEAGAQGYVSKGAKADELIEAVRVVAGGGRYIEHEIASELALSLTSAGDATKDLSARELDIMRLLAQGKNMNGISQDLGISYKTVANICTAIKQKMMVENTSELIKLAVEMHRS